MSQSYEEFKQYIKDQMLMKLLIPIDTIVAYDRSKPIFKIGKVISAYEKTKKAINK